MDNVTAKKNTPKGYSYVGSKDADILKSLGVKSSYTQDQTRRNLTLGSEKGEKGYTNKAGGVAATLLPAAKGLIAGEKSQSSVVIQTNVSYENGTDNNKNGRTFNGVTFIGNLIQPNNDLKASGGGLTVTNGNTNYLSGPLMPPQDGANNVIPSGTNFIQGTVKIPASVLSPGSLQNANISAGTTNAESIYI